MDVRCCFIQERVIEMFLVLGPLMVTGARLIAVSTEFEQFLIFLIFLFMSNVGRILRFRILELRNRVIKPSYAK